MPKAVLTLIFPLLLLSQVTWAQSAVPAPPTIAATGYLLIDMDSDTVLAAKDPEQRLEPAPVQVAAEQRDQGLEPLGALPLECSHQLRVGRPGTVLPVGRVRDHDSRLGDAERLRRVPHLLRDLAAGDDAARRPR